MKYLVVALMFLCLSAGLSAQLYFPSINSDDWDTIDPVSLDYCQNKIDSLYDFLGSNNTKGFMLLKDGKIVLEQYFNGHDATENWYWASAGKTLTAFMVGIAQQENLLDINEPTANYLSPGWTTSTLAQEEEITIKNQLSMNSGLDDGVTDPFCTEPSCLQYLAEADTRWAYHNGPYTLLDGVIENATGQSLNVYTTLKVKNQTGMDGLYINQGSNKIFFSTARSMARFGLLILNQGNWNGNQILTDTDYYNQMVTTSQSLNESYGYLWWLNGKSSYMIPQSQFVFNGSINPNAPDDLIVALGKNGQALNVVPSQNLVWLRMGESPDNSLVLFNLNDEIWKLINELKCTSSNHILEDKALKIVAYPNPIDDFVILEGPDVAKSLKYEIKNELGQHMMGGNYQNRIEVSSLSRGSYFLQIFNDSFSKTLKLIKN